MDAFGRLKPSAILFFAQQAAEGHCDLLNLDWDTLASRDLFWAVIRQKAEITRLPEKGETITLETWPMPTTRSAFPRATAGYDREGNLLFQVLGLWVLMNPKTRSMVLPGKSGVDLEGILRGTELTPPASIPPAELAEKTCRTVGQAELDRNGHMNNTKYLDWVCQLLPEAFHKEHPVKNFTVCYLSEALKNEEISLSWALRDEAVLQVDAHREKTGVASGKDRVFAAQMFF